MLWWSDSRGTCLWRIAVGIHENVIDNVEDTIREKDIRTDNLGTAIILILNDQTTSTIRNDSDLFTSSSYEIGRGALSGSILNVRWIDGSPINYLSNGLVVIW